jgi:hypothetical protein
MKAVGGTSEKSGRCDLRVNGAKRTDFDRIVQFESISFRVQAQGFMGLFLPFGS